MSEILRFLIASKPHVYVDLLGCYDANFDRQDPRIDRCNGKTLVLHDFPLGSPYCGLCGISKRELIAKGGWRNR